MANVDMYPDIMDAAGEQEDELKHMFARNFGVELLFEQHPTIPSERILERLRTECGDVDMVNKDHLQLFFFRDYKVSFAEGELPAQIAIMLPYDQVHEERGFEASLSQSWRWQEAHSTVDGCKTCMLVTDLMAAGMDYKLRMKLFQKALHAIVEACDCKAVHFRLSEQFIAREDYLSNNPGAADYDILLGILNVRLFRMEGAESEIVMDTLGLASIGLPDLQVQYKGAEVTEMAKRLYAYGDELYANGDVIPDGGTLEGLGGERWTCSRDIALMEPKRNVIDIVPGQYAIREG
ncbi:hypothetical protein FHS18_003182 [Paenibacillus phyllosphaerae]|uniref:DUF4261 domain-containing protein n=1 Tax=Paenibacillus phyllosphaerae TaxID=274593 RepID=A0A7W5AZ40_9BACL|nr:DUF4261 domain-containing protein [Paenibacillus phyllosphaerae]MBB3111114.1 hypothetical protein [Paenibacillus phyllosphaerae]